MKIAVIGSRSFSNYRLLSEKLDKIQQLQQIDVIVSGGAKGADSYSEFWANMHNVETKIFLADWDNITRPGATVKRNKYGKQYDSSAGHVRNQLIIDYADIIVAFWDGRSPGTNNAIDLAKDANKPIKVFLVDNNCELVNEYTILKENNPQ